MSVLREVEGFYDAMVPLSFEIDGCLLLLSLRELIKQFSIKNNYLPSYTEIWYLQPYWLYRYNLPTVRERTQQNLSPSKYQRAIL